MSTKENEFLDRIADDFEMVYSFFLLEYRMMDSWTARVTFYTVCETMVQNNPVLENPTLKAKILQHLAEKKTPALTAYAASIKQIFNEVAESKAAINPRE